MSKIYVIDMIKCENDCKDEVKKFWENIATALSKKAGFINGSLQESANPKSEYHFISICEWESNEHYLATLKDEAFKMLISEKPVSASFDSTVCESFIAFSKEQNLNSKCAILVNPFEIKNEEKESCLQMWNQAAKFLASQEGFLSTNFCKSLDENSRFKFINIAEWETSQHFITAVNNKDFLLISGVKKFKNHPTISIKINNVRAQLSTNTQTIAKKLAGSESDFFQSESKNLLKQDESKSDKEEVVSQKAPSLGLFQ